VAVWVPVGRDRNRVLEVGRDEARGLGRDGTRSLRVGRDLLIPLKPSREVSVGANFLALGIPNIDTRHCVGVNLLQESC